MAKEILRDLDADITRLLVAGAALAASDEGLSARRTLVSELASKAPALAKVSAQIEATRAAGGRKSASELLNLAAMSAQIRGAQARPAEAQGALEALASRAAMDTPLPSAEADKLYRVFIGKSDEPEHVLETALEANAVVDLRFARMVTSLVGGGIDEEIVVKVVRAYGEEAVRAIEERFDPSGSGADATRLQIIAQVRGVAALPLIERSFASGSADVRAQALRSWSELALDGAIEAALARGVADKAEDVREAAIEVLGRSKNNDRALDALFALLSHDDHAWSARTALREIEHPARTARAVALLTPELRVAVEYTPKAAKKGSKPATGAAAKAAKKEQERLISESIERVNLACSLVHVLPDEFDAEVEQVLFDVWKVARSSSIKEAAGEKLQRSKREDVYASLVAGIHSKEYVEREVAVGAITADRAKLYERVAPYITAKSVQDKKQTDLIDSLLSAMQGLIDSDDEGRASVSGVDPRVAELLMLALDGPNVLHWSAQELLVAMKPPGFYERVEREAREGKNRDDALELLAQLGDRRAIAFAITLMEDKKILSSIDTIRKYGPGIAEILSEFDDPSTIPAARAFHAQWSAKRKGKSGEEWAFNQFGNVLLKLERAL